MIHHYGENEFFKYQFLKISPSRFNSAGYEFNFNSRTVEVILPIQISNVDCVLIVSSNSKKQLHLQVLGTRTDNFSP